QVLVDVRTEDVVHANGRQPPEPRRGGAALGVLPVGVEDPEPLHVAGQVEVRGALGAPDDPGCDGLTGDDQGDDGPQGLADDGEHGILGAGQGAVRARAFTSSCTASAMKFPASTRNAPAKENAPRLAQNTHASTQNRTISRARYTAP